MTDRHAPAADTLRVGTYNVRDGGQDRWARQVDLLASLDLDVLGVQEAKGWDRDDSRRMYATADALGMQALLAPSPSHDCHLVTFYRWPRLRCEGHTPDTACGTFHHTASRTRLRIAGLAEPITVLHTHLDPFSPEDRLAEAGWLTGYAAPGARTVLIGDLNTTVEEPADWSRLPAHLHSRHRTMRADGTYGGTDARALHALTRAGFVDPAAHLARPAARTTGYWDPAEPWDHRSDYVLLSPEPARALVAYEVLDDPATRQLSDHLPVVATLSLDRLRR